MLNPRRKSGIVENASAFQAYWMLSLKSTLADHVSVGKTRLLNSSPTKRMVYSVQNVHCQIFISKLTEKSSNQESNIAVKDKKGESYLDIIIIISIFFLFFFIFALW